MAALSNSGLDQIKRELDALNLEKVAKESGLIKRKLRKLEIQEFLLGLLLGVLNSNGSLRNYAISIGLLLSVSISKQGIDYYFKVPLLKFLGTIVSALLSEQLKKGGFDLETDEVFKNFKRVFCEDSSVFSLEEKLAKIFPGASNGSKKKTAALKLQVVFEIVKESLVSFDITSFRKNDQSAASNILDLLEAGDLILRDLGYFVLDVFKQIDKKGAFFISRLRRDVTIYTKDGGKEIDLPRYLKKVQKANQGRLEPIELWVIIGAKAKLRVRLIIIPLPDKQANEKRRKAKNNRDRRLKISKDDLYLAGFNIFVTNTAPEIVSARQAAVIYQLRWRIEIIFKAFKSHLKMDQLPPANAIRVQAHIYLTLILVLLLHAYSKIFIYGDPMQEAGKSEFSLLRIYSFFKDHFLQVLICCQKTDMIEASGRQMHRHCQYDKHNKRINYVQKLKNLDKYSQTIQAEVKCSDINRQKRFNMHKSEKNTINMHKNLKN